MSPDFASWGERSGDDEEDTSDVQHRDGPCARGGRHACPQQLQWAVHGKLGFQPWKLPSCAWQDWQPSFKWASLSAVEFALARRHGAECCHLGLTHSQSFQHATTTHGGLHGLYLPSEVACHHAASRKQSHHWCAICYERPWCARWWGAILPCSCARGLGVQDLQGRKGESQPHATCIESALARSGQIHRL